MAENKNLDRESYRRSINSGMVYTFGFQIKWKKKKLRKTPVPPQPSTHNYKPPRWFEKHLRKEPINVLLPIFAANSEIPTIGHIMFLPARK